MLITLNGEPRELNRPLTVAELLEEMEVKSARVAVEVNMDVISRVEHDTTRLKDGDVVEVVSFIGGG